MAGILKLDQLEEITSDQGIKLSHNLKDPTGNNILTVGSSNASLGSNVQFPAGHVLQVKQEYTNTKVAKTSTGYIWQDAASITPTSTSNKVLILLNAALGQSNNNGGLKLLRNGSEFMPNLPGAFVGGATAASGALNTADDSLGTSQAYGIGNYLFSYLDSPSTTSACSYSLYWYLTDEAGASGTCIFNRQQTDNGGSSFSTMTLMEISA